MFLLENFLNPDPPTGGSIRLAPTGSRGRNIQKNSEPIYGFNKRARDLSLRYRKAQYFSQTSYQWPIFNSTLSGLQIL
jgi:hypothetical protein